MKKFLISTMTVSFLFAGKMSFAFEAVVQPGQCVTAADKDNVFCAPSGMRPVEDSLIQSDKKFCCPLNAGDIGNAGGFAAPRTCSAAQPSDKTVPAWQLLVQLAKFQPPAGCTITLLSPQGAPIDGTNFTPGQDFVIKLTNSQSQADSILIPGTANLSVTIDGGEQGTVDTKYTNCDSGKSIDTVVLSEGAPKTLSSIAVGQVSCK